ncbi:Fic family protein [Limosilactobacillus mucosae]|uniref:Fic family protein n=1 Tax=Limosilactobacillus mucosae TaxID=97478 RepID=UPI0022E5E43E|nr:Fic family protein [Limosilactobacillus mucosae]
MLDNKFKLTKDQNRRFARSNLTRLVYINSRFEGINTTLPQTQTIIDGLGVDGVPIDDINIIVQLKRGWQYVINSDEKLDLDFLKNVNRIVALNESLAPGELRTGEGGVDTELGEYKPPMVNSEAEAGYLSELLANKNSSITDKSLTLMYHLMRNQIFWDGNKRTATLVANKLMIDNGAGLISVPLDKWPEWNNLIAKYYMTNDMSKLKHWTYENGIQGVELHNSRALQLKQKLNHHKKRER